MWPLGHVAVGGLSSCTKQRLPPVRPKCSTQPRRKEAVGMFESHACTKNTIFFIFYKNQLFSLCAALPALTVCSSDNWTSLSQNGSAAQRQEVCYCQHDWWPGGSHPALQQEKKPTAQDDEDEDEDGVSVGGERDRASCSSWSSSSCSSPGCLWRSEDTWWGLAGSETMRTSNLRHMYIYISNLNH